MGEGPSCPSATACFPADRKTITLIMCARGPRGPRGPWCLSRFFRLGLQQRSKKLWIVAAMEGECNNEESLCVLVAAGVRAYSYEKNSYEALMIKRELAKDPELKNQSWERFLPKFKKFVTVPTLSSVLFEVPEEECEGKEDHQRKGKKAYTPFPPPQQPSKSGEYFLSAEMKASKKWEAKKKIQSEKAVENKCKRDASFVPPN